MIRVRLLRLLLRLTALTVLVFGVVPHVYASTTNRTCEEFAQSRPPIDDPVTPEEVRSASADVRQMRIFRLPLSLDGIAMPGVVFFDRKPHGVLWYHEMVHMAQMENDGLPRYAWNYLSDWYRGRLNGCGFHDAYMQVRYEREAYGVSESLTWVEATAFEDGGAEGLFAALGDVDYSRRRTKAFEVITAALAQR